MLIKMFITLVFEDWFWHTCWITGKSC